MGFVMTAEEFVRRHVWIATELKTMYMYAAYGFLITNATIDSKARQNLNQWYTKNGCANEKKLRAVAGKGYVGFDCVNLTKGVLWGFINDHTQPFGCGAVHGAHGVPDTNANGMITYCYDVSTDFSRITPGEGLWMEGHWGVYVGDGRAVECTNWKYKDGVQITAVGNIGKISGLPSHTWTKHGRLPWVDYTNSGAVFVPLRNGYSGDAVRKMQEMLLSLHYNLGRWGADGDFGAATENAVMEFQDRNGLTVTGICDEKTMETLEKLSTGGVDKSEPVDNPDAVGAGATSGADRELDLPSSATGGGKVSSTVEGDGVTVPTLPPAAAGTSPFRGGEDGSAEAAAPADPALWNARIVRVTDVEKGTLKAMFGNRCVFAKG